MKRIIDLFPPKGKRIPAPVPASGLAVKQDSVGHLMRATFCACNIKDPKAIATENTSIA